MSDVFALLEQVKRGTYNNYVGVNRSTSGGAIDDAQSVQSGAAVNFATVGRNKARGYAHEISGSEYTEAN